MFPISYKQFPLYLYQITNKYRDEIKPRFGLIRGREFVMKDLYTFDTDIFSAQDTYDLVNKSYEKIFDQLGINYVKGKLKDLKNPLLSIFYYNYIVCY